MKILNFWMVAFMALSLSTTLTSCSDDDEKKEDLKSATIIQYTIKGRFMSR